MRGIGAHLRSGLTRDGPRTCYYSNGRADYRERRSAPIPFSTGLLRQTETMVRDGLYPTLICEYRRMDATPMPIQLRVQQPLRNGVPTQSWSKPEWFAMRRAQHLNVVVRNFATRVVSACVWLYIAALAVCNRAC